MSDLNKDFIKKLKSDPGTMGWYEENKDHLNYAEQEKYRFLKDVFEKGKPMWKAYAAYGPEEDGYNNAYIDDVFFPEEGGTFTKYYGCPFKSKGMAPGNVVYGLQLSKYLFSNFIKHIWYSSKLLAFFFGLTWLFDRNGFLKILIHLLDNIDRKVVERLTYSEKIKGRWPDKWYNKCEKEIERCLVESSKGEKYWDLIFRLLGKFLKLFLYIDNTYRSRVQDALSEGKDIFGTLEVLIKREKGPVKTWIFMKYILKLALLTSPALKRTITKFFKGLDREKMKMDLDDWYFALPYKSYDFRGLPHEKRRAERDEMNKKYQVVYL